MKLHTLLSNMKHVEFQVLADKYGNVVHLGERDYSVQRRFQKLVEEAPCPIVSPFWRMKMGAATINVALALDYAGALTVEFFYFPETRKFYFSEIDSRVQVEHCVTEMVTGIDIVRKQIRIAQGEELSFSQDDIRINIHAIECRINAEDALAILFLHRGLSVNCACHRGQVFASMKESTKIMIFLSFMTR